MLIVRMSVFFISVLLLWVTKQSSTVNQMFSLHLPTTTTKTIISLQFYYFAYLDIHLYTIIMYIYQKNIKNHNNTNYIIKNIKVMGHIYQLMISLGLNEKFKVLSKILNSTIFLLMSQLCGIYRNSKIYCKRF